MNSQDYEYLARYVNTIKTYIDKFTCDVFKGYLVESCMKIIVGKRNNLKNKEK